MRTTKINKQKFVNHLLYTHAQELAKDCERWGKDEWASELHNVELESAESDVLSYVRSYVLSYIRSYVLSDVLSYVRSDVLSDVLSYIRSDVLSYVRSYVQSDVRSQLTQEYITAYIYAGGRLNALKKNNLNRITLKNIKNGELRQENWHTCETTHCRGGWYIVALRDAGSELEELVGSEMAASMIAFVNMGEIPYFHNFDNDEVLEDIKLWAEREKAQS